MCTSTIIEEIAQVPWEILPKDPKLQEFPPEQILNEIDEINYFLNNPNDNKGETISKIFRAFLRDSLELDAGCVVKGFSESGYERHPAVAPMEFDVNEVVYASRYPRSYGVYGLRFRA